MPGPDGRGVSPTSGGLGGAPNPIWVTSIPAGSQGFLPVSERAFIKSAGTTKPNQIRTKTQNMEQLNKAKTDSKSSPRCRESRTAPKVPVLVRCAMARNVVLLNGVGDCTEASVVWRRLVPPTSASEGERAPPPPPIFSLN